MPKTAPLITKQTAVELEMRLAAHFRPEDETLVGTLDRLLRARDLERYDRSAVEHARKEAKELRVMFGAAILSAENQELRIDRRAQQRLNGPERFELISYEDMATNCLVFKIRER